MRRARGKTAKRGKIPENYSTSAKIARISRTNSIAFEHALLTSHSCLIRARALRRARISRHMYNVTEDADLGYRLARARLHADVIGPPTWEEAPATLGAWLNQRTRWIKGHLQTWLVLMRNPFRAAHEMGFRAFAAMQLTLGCGLLAAFAHGPLAAIVLYAAISPQDVLGPAGFILALCGYCTAVFAALTASAIANDLSHARAALTMPLYWPLASIAAYRALLELLVRPHHWRKTAHGVSPRARRAFALQRNAVSAAAIDSMSASA
ncbi:MAG TPA: glycosyltransferase family 2 protein [Terricaulis sp.]|nr:glycosyltransferase family 2 protein [Terricaulis sp.]